MGSSHCKFSDVFNVQGLLHVIGGMFRLGRQKLRGVGLPRVCQESPSPILQTQQLQQLCATAEFM